MHIRSLILVISVCTLDAFGQTVGIWEEVNPMNNAQRYPTATVWNNTSIVISGTFLTEIYDSVASTWTRGVSIPSWHGHTATVLPGGKILRVGGSNYLKYLNSTEIIDVEANTTTFLSELPERICYHTATLLQDGNVLVVAGSLDISPYVTARCYLLNSTTSTWISVPSLKAPRMHHTATLLKDGRVFVAGGREDEAGNFVPLNSTEIYDPSTNTWSDGPQLLSARNNHGAVLLQSGEVLIFGGDFGLANRPLTSSEIFDPVGIIRQAGAMHFNRFPHLAVGMLGCGMVITVGNAFEDSNTAELYDPSVEAWSLIANMSVERMDTAVAVLGGYTVYVFGGNFGGIYEMQSVESLYDLHCNQSEVTTTSATTSEPVSTTLSVSTTSTAPNTSDSTTRLVLSQTLFLAALYSIIVAALMH